MQLKIQKTLSRYARAAQRAASHFGSRERCVPGREYIKHEEGAALPAVLVILTVIATLVGTVMAVRLVQFRFIQRDVSRVQAYYAAEAGLHDALTMLEDNLRWPPQGDVSCTARAQCQAHVEPFGGYVRMIVRATVDDQAHRLRALVGQVSPPAFRNAVALGEKGADLTLAGAASVAGDVALHGGKIAHGLLPGVSRGGEVDGAVLDTRTQQAAERAFPTYSAHVPRFSLQRIEGVLQEARDWPTDLYAGVASQGEENSTTTDSCDRPRRVHIGGDLVVTPRDSGHFRSATALYVRGNLTVEGALRFPPGSRLVARDTLRIDGAVHAPESLLYGGRLVRIQQWASGAAQVLSRRKVTVGGNAHLNYPSVLYVDGWLQKAETGPSMRRRGWIRLTDHAHVDGTLLYPSLPDPTSGAVEEDVGTIVIGNGATLRGALYSAARARVEGIVYGSVLAERLFFYRSPTRYLNWMIGGHIDRGRRPTDYAAPVGMYVAGGADETAGQDVRLTLIRLREPVQTNRVQPGGSR